MAIGYYIVIYIFMSAPRRLGTGASVPGISAYAGGVDRVWPRRWSGHMGLETLGIVRPGRVHWNLSGAALYEAAIQRGEGILAAEGPLVARTGQHTGRAPNDKFIVRESSSEHDIHWGSTNRPMDEAKFDAFHSDMVAYLEGRDLFVLDAWAGADPRYRLPIRV